MANKQRIKEVLKGVFQEALRLPMDNLDKIDPTKLQKIAQKTDVVIGESDFNRALFDKLWQKTPKDILVGLAQEIGFPTVLISDIDPSNPKMITDDWGKKFFDYLFFGSNLAGHTFNNPKFKFEETEFDTATPEQQQAVKDVLAWASELDLDIGPGEETIGDTIKFTFQGSDSVVTILIDSHGKIKMSGHAITNFDDFSDMVQFFQS